MKSRATLCLLLAAVVGVWGLVAWRLLAPAKRPPEAARPASASASAAAAPDDTLRLDYPDPFLKGATAPKRASRSVVRPLPSGKKAAPTPRERTKILHLATVAAGGRALHIVEIGGGQYELCMGDEAAGFRLHAADTDSLYFRKDGRIYGVERCRP